MKLVFLIFAVFLLYKISYGVEVLTSKTAGVDDARIMHQVLIVNDQDKPSVLISFERLDAASLKLHLRELIYREDQAASGILIEEKGEYYFIPKFKNEKDRKAFHIKYDMLNSKITVNELAPENLNAEMLSKLFLDPMIRFEVDSTIIRRIKVMENK